MFLTNFQQNKKDSEKNLKTSQQAGFSSFTTKSNQSLSKSERITSSRQISLVFAEAQSVTKYPILLFYKKRKSDDLPLVRAAFTVSKKKFKRAVDRNKVKRLLREVHRKNKLFLSNQLPASQSIDLVYVYIGKKIESYHHIEAATKQLFDNLAKQ